MESKEIIVQYDTPHAFLLTQAKLNRVAKIFYNLSIGLLIAIFAMLLSSVFGPLLYICLVLVLLAIMACMLIFTLGTVFVFPGSPLQKIWHVFQTVTGANDSIMSITASLFNWTKWVALVGMITSVIAIILIANGKKYPKVGRIVLMSFFIVVMLVVFVFQMVTRGVQL